ncbi:DUF4158 domain-containing protein [Nocardia rhizosphaerae]|uniref:DUF4158 domain-containing protein n=1 Tax=Nocardia rhizosphaerae TaxID=1691571 RepID=A0ABV8LC44_9NOCA
MTGRASGVVARGSDRVVDAGRERLAVGGKQGRGDSVGFRVFLKFFESEARSPRGPEELPAVAIVYMAEQLKVDPIELDAYPWSGRSAKYHREQIREEFGFRGFSVGDEDKLARWLAAEVCPVELREEQLREALLVRCRVERIEPTTPGRIERLIGSARRRWHEDGICWRS